MPPADQQKTTAPFPRTRWKRRLRRVLLWVLLLPPSLIALVILLVYLPPVHPIGNAFKKGKNNTLDASDADPGSPWAIGSAAGGHAALHPDLGDWDAFDRLVAKANDLGIEIALDFALPAFPVGKGCSVNHHDVFAQIQRTGPDAFDLYVFRSFARAFWTSLCHAAEEVGYEVA